jgi:CubicO group peptidase (beta-lactamase class C family)
MDTHRILFAVEKLIERESSGPRDMRAYLDGGLRVMGDMIGTHEFDTVSGPVIDGGGPSGIVTHRGDVLASWGDPDRLEMSFSMTKSYLSLVAGVAFDKELLQIDGTVSGTLDDEMFDGPRNSLITWRHLLQQTSEWNATLWGKPWWSDPQGKQRPDDPPAQVGLHFAYNDVRINVLARALTRLFGESLHDVAHTSIWQPLGSSGTAEWHGYEGADITVGGKELRCVSGGAHWGGGLFSSATDHALVGNLVLNRGRSRGRKLLSEEWIDASLTPSSANPDYGFLWWLNHRGRIFPDAPQTGFCARGNLGRQLLWVDPARQLVVVSRWADEVGQFLGEVSAAVNAKTETRTA